MARAIALRDDFDAAALRQLAKNSARSSAGGTSGSPPHPIVETGWLSRATP